jgi:hypothetical protein
MRASAARASLSRDLPPAPNKAWWPSAAVGLAMGGRSDTRSPNAFGTNESMHQDQRHTPGWQSNQHRPGACAALAVIDRLLNHLISTG